MLHRPRSDRMNCGGAIAATTAAACEKIVDRRGESYRSLRQEYESLRRTDVDRGGSHSQMSDRCGSLNQTLAIAAAGGRVLIAAVRARDLFGRGGLLLPDGSRRLQRGECRRSLRRTLHRSRRLQRLFGRGGWSGQHHCGTAYVADRRGTFALRNEQPTVTADRHRFVTSESARSFGRGGKHNASVAAVNEGSRRVREGRTIAAE